MKDPWHCRPLQGPHFDPTPTGRGYPVQLPPRRSSPPLQLNQGHHAECLLLICRVKNCPHKNKVNIGQSSTHLRIRKVKDMGQDTIFLQGNFVMWPNIENKCCIMFRARVFRSSLLSTPDGWGKKLSVEMRNKFNLSAEARSKFKILF